MLKHFLFVIVKPKEGWGPTNPLFKPRAAFSGPFVPQMILSVNIFVIGLIYYGVHDSFGVHASNVSFLGCGSKVNMTPTIKYNLPRLQNTNL